MMGGSIVWWVLLSTCLGQEKEGVRMLFGCKMYFDFEREPDCCIMMKVLSGASMKLQVYWREDEAMTMMVFHNVSHFLSGNYSHVGEQRVVGLAYNLSNGEVRSIFNSLFESLRGKFASNGYLPETLEFFNPFMLSTRGVYADGQSGYKSMHLERIFNEPDWNVEIARKRKRMYPHLYITPNAVIDRYFSPTCGANIIDPGHYYGYLYMDVIRMEISVVSSSVMRLEVLLGGEKTFVFPQVEYLFDRSTCIFTAQKGEGKMTVDGKSSAVSLEKMLEVARVVVHLGEVEMRGKFLDKMINVNGLDLKWRSEATMKLATNAAGNLSLVACFLAIVIANIL